MAKVTMQPFVPVPSGRTREQILVDLDAVKAEHKRLHPLCEADEARVRRREASIETSKKVWAKEHPGEPWDGLNYNPPLVPLDRDEALHRTFHAVHYEIARLQDELDAVDPRAAPNSIAAELAAARVAEAKARNARPVGEGDE